MSVLDAYAVVAFLRDEPGAGQVEDLLREGAVLTAVNAAEVVDQLVRVWGHPPDDVLGRLALLEDGGLRIAPTTVEVGVLAGELRAAGHHRVRAAVSLADCVAAATALSLERPLATADPALAGLLRAAGGEVHGLPDTAGRLP